VGSSALTRGRRESAAIADEQPKVGAPS